MIVEFHGGWAFVEVPWLAAMVGLFAFEFIEGNTITRLYFMRLRRLGKEALLQGKMTTQLERARSEGLPTFTHFLDLPVLFLIVALGTLRPTNWTLFFMGLVAAVVVASLFTRYIPKLYPWDAGERV